MTTLRPVLRSPLRNVLRDAFTYLRNTASSLILDSLKFEENGMVLHFESDTALVRDTVQVSSGELVTNGTFDTDISGWSSATSTGTGSISWVSGSMQLDSDTTSNRARASQSFTTIIGARYYLSYTNTKTIHTRAGTTENGSDNLQELNVSEGSNFAYFIATATTTWVTFEGFRAVGDEPILDNVSVTLVNNNYDGSFNTETSDFLTYTSPSPKMILHADGELKFAAHNLYLNSGAPATQNITVVSGHPYKLIVTGTTSITVSGAGTGTATAGSPVTFTAGTTTATLTLDSGTGTAQFFNTPASETYLETTGSARYALPIEYDSAGASKGVLIEPAATNIFLNSDTLSTQGITTTAASWTVSFYGTGTITFSGTHTGSLVGTGANDRVEATFTPTAGTLTCTVSGTVSKAQAELGSVATSYTPTYGSTVTRAADQLSLATSAFPFNAAAISTIVKYELLQPLNTNAIVYDYYEAATTDNYLRFYNSTGQLRGESSSVVTIKVSNPDASLADGVHIHGASSQLDDHAATYDGNTVGTDVSGAMPLNLDTLSIGRGADFHAHLKFLKHLDRAIEDAELQSDTTP